MLQVENLYIEQIDKTINCNFLEGITHLSGKNGSGKTLLLDYISGLRKLPKNASILNSGSTIYMKQNFRFHNRVILKEFIEFIEKINDQNITAFKKFTQKYFPDFSYEEIAHTKLGMLSGGERRFIYILTILSIERKWYILDEPFTNIDKDRRETLKEIIVSMSNFGSNFIITSHDTFGIQEARTVQFEDIVHDNI